MRANLLEYRGTIL